MGGVAPQCECTNASELHTYKLLKWYIYVMYTLPQIKSSSHYHRKKDETAKTEENA